MPPAPPHQSITARAPTASRRDHDTNTEHDFPVQGDGQAGLTPPTSNIRLRTPVYDDKSEGWSAGGGGWVGWVGGGWTVGWVSGWVGELVRELVGGWLSGWVDCNKHNKLNKNLVQKNLAQKKRIAQK